MTLEQACGWLVRRQSFDMMNNPAFLQKTPRMKTRLESLRGYWGNTRKGFNNYQWPLQRKRWICDQKYGRQENNQDCDANENPSRLEQVGQVDWEQQGQQRLGLEHEVSEHQDQQHLGLDGKFQFKRQQWCERVKSIRGLGFAHFSTKPGEDYFNQVIILDALSNYCISVFF